MGHYLSYNYFFGQLQEDDDEYCEYILCDEPTNSMNSMLESNENAGNEYEEKATDDAQSEFSYDGVKQMLDDEMKCEFVSFFSQNEFILNTFVLFLS